ncbi:hypothetical protein YUYDRAFT_03808 [Streptomyces sp. ScaeMP-e48]|uniref:Uncharacterized protein n=1 Tax=Streptomyces microflavus TaxID=1919 RepID=A0A7J0D3P8_STRMI|nr:hypothetical protein Smic_79090 [Streptomyces microflavus]SCK32891.1 hypothetical protein YUYDRAFT_03808 [Streptomyces sp. ScaeMP-e48]
MVSGTFTDPAQGNLRANAVLTVPGRGCRCCTSDAVAARKIESYRQFLQRTTEDHRGRDVPFWQSLWDELRPRRASVPNPGLRKE